MKAFGERVAKRRGQNVATVAVARKLVVIAWNMLSRGEDYAFARPTLVAPEDPQGRARRRRPTPARRPGQAVEGQRDRASAPGEGAGGPGRGRLPAAGGGLEAGRPSGRLRDHPRRR